MMKPAKFLLLMVWLSVQCLAFAQVPSAAPTQPIKLDAQTRQEVIEAALKALNDKYVFPETAKKMEAAVRERLARGEYDKVESPPQFARMLTEHLLEVSHDRHLNVIFSPNKIPPPPANSEPTPEQRAQQRAAGARQNFGFVKVEQLDGNIGYLDLRMFAPPDFAGDAAAAAMNFLYNTDALIIDLRQNGGGDPAMVALLCSYFFDKRTHLNDIYWRPNDSTREFWTLETLAGRRYGAKPIWVLTSKRTFSGGEEFAYDLKNLKRATLVGEVTGGGAHPTTFQRLHDHFGMGVPAGRAINPITKTDWEGTGVQPDVAVRASEALRVAHVAAVQSLLAQATDPARKQDLQDLWQELEAASKPAPTDAGGLELPKTPAGEALRTFLLALNSGDIGQMRLFQRAQGRPPFLARRDLDFFQQSGGIKAHKVLSSSAHRLEVLVQQKKDDKWLKLTMETETDAPHYARNFGFSPAEPPAK